MKTAIQGVFGLLLAALLLYWVLHGLDRNILREAIGRASWSMLAIGAAINLGHNVFRVWRWRGLLAPVRRDVPFRPMFAAVILGYMTTWLVPGRVGELVRPALLSAKENIPLGPCVGTVVADRLLDGVAIVGLFAFGSLGASFTAASASLAAEIRLGAWLALGTIVVCLAGLIAVSTAGPRVESWLSRRAKPIRWIGQAALGLSQGVAALRSPRRVVPILAYSFAAWLTIALGTWLGIRAAGAEISFSDSLVMLLPLALGVAIPTPGGVGGYHAAMKWGLTSLFGVDPVIAAGAGILMHLAILLPVLGLGPILLSTEKVSWADMVAAAKQVRSMGHTPDAIEATR
jgi:glycosyltransferase 2 family protein